MHNVVIEKPYSFVPPYRGRLWPAILQRLAMRWLRREYRITAVECTGLEKLAQSIRDGHGVLIAANHSRPGDAFVVIEAGRRAGAVLHTVASWHLFMQGRLQAWLLRRAGAFSIYREGMDRAAVNASIEILAEARRPLVIFPEGVISRTNDRLNGLMQGTSLIARGAAKKRVRAEPAGRVVVHPLAIKYRFGGDVDGALAPVLEDIERRLSWRPQQHLPLTERIYKAGGALLCLKELEHLGKPQEGIIPERLARLIDHLLVPLEKEWLNGKAGGAVVTRVKQLRTAILPDMIRGEIAETERDRRWRLLADVYLAQQLAAYPPDYVRSSPSAERMLETVERFEEDLTDAARAHGPMTAHVEVGGAIEVDPERERGSGEDPLMARLETELRKMVER